MQKVTKSLLLLAGGAVLVTGIFSACSKSKSNSSLPPIGGYNASNDVASSNLMAHWTFDNTLNESKSSAAPSIQMGNSYTTGIKGQALNLSSGYLKYPTIAALNTPMASFTVSAWVKTANNGSTVSTVFALTEADTAQSDWNNGPIELYIETARSKTKGDTIDLHTAFGSYVGGAWLHGDNINDYGAADTDFQYVIASPTTWIHYVSVYDASASTINIYANGKLVSNNKFAYRAISGVPIGSLTYPTPTQVLIGSFANPTSGYAKIAAQTWQAPFTGTIDELRVYNKALSASDISALYQLETAGR